MLKIIFAPLLMLALLTGCASMDKAVQTAERHPGAVVLAQGVVTFVVLKYADDTEKAARVIRATDAAIALVQGNEVVTLSELEAAVLAEIDFTRMAPEEAALVRTLIAAVKVELQARLAQDELISPENAVAIVAVLGWVRAAAGLRLPPGTVA